MFFRLIAGGSDPLIGAKAAAGFLMFGTASGVLMALFLNNAGGAWDNAKKYIEDEHYGGKGSEAHKASVTGDTVGDPCKVRAPRQTWIAASVMLIFVSLTPPFSHAPGHGWPKHPCADQAAFDSHPSMRPCVRRFGVDCEVGRAHSSYSAH